MKLLADCRLLRKDELQVTIMHIYVCVTYIHISKYLNLYVFLQVIKSSLNPRAPDCFQRTPRRVNIMESSNDSLLTISIDGQGTFF